MSLIVSPSELYLKTRIYFFCRMTDRSTHQVDYILDALIGKDNLN